jgi:hypothetical protein
VNNGLIFLLYAQPPVWRACPTLDKIVAAHDLSMFVGLSDWSLLFLCDG